MRDKIRPFNEQSARRIVAGARRLEQQFPAMPLAMQRRRTPAIFDRGVPFTADDDMPAYGVFVVESAAEVSDDDPSIVYSGTQATVHGGGSILLVNGDTDVDEGDQGVARRAVDRPVWALYDSEFPPRVGEACGVESASYQLARGLPGFICLALDSGNGTVLVQRVEGDNSRTGQLNGQLGDDGGTVELWYAGQDTRLTVSAQDDMLQSQTTIPSDTWVTVEFRPSERLWILVNAACPGN